MQEKILELKVITPLYNRGMEDDVGLKIPSLRGILRFWWRAIKSENNISLLKVEEQKIFGGISGAAIASPVKFRLIKESDSKPVPFSKSATSNKAKYLSLGLSSMGSPERLCIESGTYHIAMQYPQEIYEELRRSILAFHYFGNLGAKSRNGFGSLYLNNFTEFCDEQTDTPEKFFKTVISQTILPNYSAFSNKARLYESLNVFDSAGEALQKISEMYFGIRTTIEASFSYSIRKYLSFPVGPMVKEQHIFNSKDGRYSKPYFFKVYRLAENEYKVFVLNLVHQYAHELENSSQSHNYNALNNSNLQSEFEYACTEFNTKLVNEHKFRRVQ